MTRVLIADDQELVRTGLRMILEAHAGITIVGEACDGAEAVSQTIGQAPDVVLMDIQMPNVDGLEATKRLVLRSDVTAKILILTTFDSDEYVFEAIRQGASGFMLKDAPAVDLIHAIEVVARGETLLAPSITRRLIERQAKKSVTQQPAELGHLTEREVEVLMAVARGLSNAEIGAALFLSEATVKTHVSRVLRKLGLRDRVQAAIYAYERGLIEPGAD